jgi:hypothetical protein
VVDAEAEQHGQRDPHDHPHPGLARGDRVRLPNHHSEVDREHPEHEESEPDQSQT